MGGINPLTEKMGALGQTAPKLPEADGGCPSCTGRQKKRAEQKKACLTKLKGYGQIGAKVGGLAGPVGTGLGGSIGGMVALGSEDCQFGLMGAGAPGDAYFPPHLDPGTGQVVPGHFEPPPGS